MNIKKIMDVLKDSGILPQSDKEMIAIHQGLLTLEEVQMFRAKSKRNKRDLPTLILCLYVTGLVITFLPEDIILSVLLNIVLGLNTLLWICVISLQRLDFQKRCILSCLEKLK